MSFTLIIKVISVTQASDHPKTPCPYRQPPSIITTTTTTPATQKTMVVHRIPVMRTDPDG